MVQETDPRHEARKLALQVLFEWSFLSSEIDEMVRRHVEQFGTDEDAGNEIKEFDEKLASTITKGVTDHIDELDEIIAKSAPEWPINQIAKIDLEILRMSIFELYIAKEVPPKVAIDEAIELGKEYGGENSGKFINGVLGTVVKNYLEKGKDKPSTEVKKESKSKKKITKES